MARIQKLEASKLTVHVGYWMRLVSNNVSHSFRRKLESSGVTVAEWVILREMYSGDDTTSPSIVAELTGLTRGAVSKLVSRLLEKGLVLRDESSNDRRYQDIKLTAKAIALIPKLASLADQNDEEFFAKLTKSERNQLIEILQKLAKLHQIKTKPID
ncbi:MAG: MarR family transcriptional regulator [Bdellovibrionales bacterium]|nr:MarR family transcriptional regulator [Bdellovibrionales bacterium]